MGDAREREHVVVGERITRAYLPSCILQTLECASVLSPEKAVGDKTIRRRIRSHPLPSSVCEEILLVRARVS
jgi:hypothetical protein